MGLGVVGLQSGRIFGDSTLGMHKFSSSEVRSWLFKLRLQQFQFFQFRVLGFRVLGILGFRADHPGANDGPSSEAGKKKGSLNACAN